MDWSDVDATDSKEFNVETIQWVELEGVLTTIGEVTEVRVSG